MWHVRNFRVFAMTDPILWGNIFSFIFKAAIQDLQVCPHLPHNCLNYTVWPKTTPIMKTRLFKYIENFTTKNWKFSDKNSDIFHISAQNIDRGYSLEPPRSGCSNEYQQSMFLRKIMYNPVNPIFFLYKDWIYGGQNYIGMFSWCQNM